MSTPTENWQGDDLTRASEMWGRGMSCSEIASALGHTYTRSMIASKAKRLRHMFPARIVQLQPDLEAMATVWNGTTKSSAEIGRQFGISQERVREIASKHPGMFEKRKAGPKYQNKPPVAKNLSTGWRSAGPVSVTAYTEPSLDDYDQSRLPGLLLWENEGCKYPLTQTGPHRFCGCNKLELKPYCAYHAVKVAGPGTVSERRAVRDARKFR
jgi:Uncharacterized protein conserved in bacteria